MAQRVHIFGGAGSGKTYLAQAVSAKHGLAHYELDDFFWANAATRHARPTDERDKQIAAAAATERWVIEGIFWQGWVRPSLERADKIIVLDVPEVTRHMRVVRRHLKLVRHAPVSDYPTFFPTLWELLKLNRQYQEGPLRATMQLLAPYASRVSVCSHYRQAAEVLDL